MINGLVLAKIVYLLGWLNLAAIVLVFFSCRCLTGPKLFTWLVRFEWYKKFYRTHCWWWYLFFASVAGHALVALSLYGNPFK